MKRAREAREAQGGNHAAATAAAATTTTTAPRAPRKRPTGSKGEKGTKSKGELKGKKGVDKVQKSTKAKKVGVKAVRKAKQKTKGKKEADKDEVEDQDLELDPEPESEPVSKGKGKANKVADEDEVENQEPKRISKGKAKGKEVVDRVQKGTQTKKRGIKAVWKAKQKAKLKEVADKAELNDPETSSKGNGKVKGKGKEVAAAKVNKAEARELQAADKVKGKGKEKAIAAEKGKDEIVKRFTRADLQKSGALESDHLEMPSLTNDIHPIWALEKFRFCSGTNRTERAKAYAAISPALRLVSLWIEQPQYEDFWATMWHGQYAKPGTNGRLLRITSLSEDQAKSIKENNSGKHLTWKEFRDFASLKEFKCEWRFGQQALGTWADTEEGIDGFSGCVTTLHDDFEWLARSPQSSTTTSERLRSYFFLAVNLGRELVQQVCRFKHRAQFGVTVGPLDRSMVFFQSPNGAGFQLDVAWENFMFKGPIRQINSPKGPMAPDGLAVHHVRLKDDSQRLFMPVRVDWINEQFSMGSWFAEDFALPGLPDRSNFYARELAID